MTSWLLLSSNDSGSEHNVTVVIDSCRERQTGFDEASDTQRCRMIVDTIFMD